jgi:hypothetical protein
MTFASCHFLKDYFQLQYSPVLRSVNSQCGVFRAKVLWAGKGNVVTLGSQAFGGVFVDGTWRESRPLV